VYVEVDLSRSQPVLKLRDADDFTAFKLVVIGEAAGLAEAIVPLGRLADPEHAYLRPDAVAALSGEGAAEAGWRKRFDGMLAYAAAKGWADERGDVRAHIEYR
jgi:hypothetical protein